MIRHLMAFFVLGALLLTGKRALSPAAAPEAPELLVRVRSTATEAEVQRAIDEAVLAEEALARGGAFVDPVVRDRLVQAMRRPELAGRFAEESDRALVGRAVTLGLPREDPVVRQRLAYQAEQLVLAPAAEAVTDAELARYLHEHSGRYAVPARYALAQVFFSRSRRGDRLEGEAIAAVRRLREGAPIAGDSSLLPAECEAVAVDLDRRFGPGFGAAVAKLRPGEWSDPIPSAYGLHAVRLREATPERPAPLSSVRERVLADYRHDRLRELLSRRVRALRAAYRVEVRRWPS